ncbi:MAG: MBOAT family protein, partial [Negativibacillus sp.]
ASWNFVLWGAFYGILLMVEKLGLLRWLQRIPAVFSHLYLLFVTLIGWTLFYTTDLSRLAGYFRVMFGGAGNPMIDPQLSITFANHLFWLLAALLFCLPLTQWCKSQLESWVAQDGRGQGRQALVSIGTAMMNLALLLVCTALLVGDSYNPFLYFRF